MILNKNLINLFQVVFGVGFLFLFFILNNLLGRKYYNEKYKRFDSSATGRNFILVLLNPNKYFKKDTIGEGLIIKIISILCIFISIYCFGRFSNLI